MTLEELEDIGGADVLAGDGGADVLAGEGGGDGLPDGGEVGVVGLDGEEE